MPQRLHKWALLWLAQRFIWALVLRRVAARRLLAQAKVPPLCLLAQAQVPPLCLLAQAQVPPFHRLPPWHAAHGKLADWLRPAQGFGLLLAGVVTAGCGAALVRLARKPV